MLLTACCNVKLDWVIDCCIGLLDSLGKWFDMKILGSLEWLRTVLHRDCSPFLIGGTSAQLQVLSRYKITVFLFMRISPIFMACAQCFRG